MVQVRNLQTGIKFKDTPIGKIPVDWSITALKEITFFEYGESLPEKNRKEGKIKVYGSNGLIGNHDEKLVDGPGIVVGRKGTVGAVTWVEGDFWPIDTTYYISKKNTNENLKWLYYLLLSLHLERLNAATGIPGLNRGEALSLLIPIPPLPEQKKIAEILSTVDDAIKETDKIIDQIRELKKGMMQKLLTRGIGHKKFKKTAIGNVPVEWKIGKISDYGEVVTGSTPNTAVKEYYGNDYPFVTPFDLGGTKIISVSEKYLSKRGAVVARMLPTNTVLFVCIGSTIGKTGIAGTHLATNQQINSIVCKENDHNFVYYYLTFINNKIKKLAGTQAVPIVNKSLFSGVSIAIPKINEQKEIGEILSSVDLEIENEEKKKSVFESFKKSLMQVLLTGKVRIKAH